LKEQKPCPDSCFADRGWSRQKLVFRGPKGARSHPRGRGRPRHTILATFIVSGNLTAEAKLRL